MSMDGEGVCRLQLILCIWVWACEMSLKPN
jgi:hypothetical protein